MWLTFGEGWWVAENVCKGVSTFSVGIMSEVTSKDCIF